jgi:trigger factor
MQVIKNSSEGLKQHFTVTIPAGTIASEMDTKLAEVGRTVRIPGFRPGKVPMTLLRKKYGPSVMGEVVENAVNSGAQKAIADNDLRPALRPEIAITSYKEGGDLEFTVQVEVLPEVEVQDLSALSLERPVAEVTDAVIDEALERIASRRETTEPAAKNHKAKSGDVVTIDFEGSVDGVAFDGGKAEGYDLKLGSNSFIPGFEEQLIGVKKDDKTTVKVAFPADYGAEHLAGKDAEFAITVHEVKTVKPAAVDDELAKQLGLEDLAALRASVRGEIERDYASMSRAHLKRHLLDALAEGHSFAVPEGMVTLEFDAIWKQVEEDRAQGRVDPSDEGKSDDELKSEYRSIAERRVRLGLLLSEVGRKNNVQISQEDLNRAVFTEARNYPGQEHLVIQYYQKNPEAKEALRAPIFEEKVVDFIIELAKVSDKTVSVDDLRADPDEVKSETEVKTEAESKQSGDEREADNPKAKPKKAKAAKTEEAPAAEAEAAPAAEAEAKPAKKAAPKKKAAAAKE